MGYSTGVRVTEMQKGFSGMVMRVNRMGMRISGMGVRVLGMGVEIGGLVDWSVSVRVSGMGEGFSWMGV